MSRECHNPQCTRFSGRKWYSFAMADHHYHLHDQTFCSHECLRIGLGQALDTERQRRQKSRLDLKKSRLGLLLLAEGILTREQLEIALKLQAWSAKKPLGQCLIELGYVSADQLTFYLSEQERVPYLRQPRMVMESPQVAIYTIPAHAARLTRCIPYTFNFFTRELSLACIAPLDMDVCQSVGRILDCKVVPFLIQETMFTELVHQLPPAESAAVHVDDQVSQLMNGTDCDRLAGRIMSRAHIGNDAHAAVALIRDTLWLRITFRLGQTHHFFPVNLPTLPEPAETSVP